ncbi:MAG: alpha-glutamyl/putrescinyl thymine pyrophosphorylase clade 3 protein [Solirubrobacteraceae bacterium]
MPTFCRHNRFIERCPICSSTLPGSPPEARSARPARAAGDARQGAAGNASRRSRAGMRVRREGRAVEDGYSSELAPGLRASADAARLAAEIDFAVARLAALAADPPGLYGEAAALGRAAELDRASWIGVLIAYLCPTEQDDPFASIRAVLEAAPGPDALPAELGVLLEEAQLGPRSSHQPGRGATTLTAYAHWLARNGPTQAAAFGGDPAWTPDRRFARVYERLALPGLTRAARYELLVSLGRLGLFELRPASLQLTDSRGQSDDTATAGAKRVFGIGDPILLERRAAALARAAEVPIEALDLGLANWQGPERASMGFAAAAGGAGEAEPGEAAAVTGAAGLGGEAAAVSGAAGALGL